jgi:hypothetical protein
MVDHDDDLIELWKNIVRIPVYQVRVLQSDIGREQRLRNTPARFHPVETEAPRKVTDKVNKFSDRLWDVKETCRKKRFNTRRHRQSFLIVQMGDFANFGDLYLTMEILDGSLVPW